MTSKSKINLGWLAGHLARNTIPSNPKGFTLDPVTLCDPAVQCRFPKNTFYVSLKGHEQKFDCNPSFESVYGWLYKHRRTIGLSGHFIGGWQKKGIYYLDISIAVVGLQQVFAIAHQNGQEAIYHIASGETIHVPKQWPFAA